MNENDTHAAEGLPLADREAIRLTDTAAAMLMHRLRESVPWREAAREYERVYPGRSSDDMIDVLRWLSTRAGLTDTLRAENATLRTQVAWVQQQRDDALTELTDTRRFWQAAQAQLAETRAQMKAVVAALEDLVDESYSRIEPPSWVHPATGKGVYRCLHCGATKGERVQAHAMDCAVGYAEKVLAGMR